MKIKNKFIFGFILVYHLLLIVLLPLVLSWNYSMILFLITYLVGGLCITIGYHRYYAHRSYNANSLWEWFILIGATLSLEMSALQWAYDHRIHHKHCDTDKDPYSIKKGFWYAHVLWLFDYQRNFDKNLVKDLMKKNNVLFQDKYFIHLTICANLIVFLIGCLISTPLEAFYYGVLLRIALIHHCTWFINSLCHTYGAKTYAKELSAVDNALLAFLTFGEGYHNYHHAYAADYRNGIRWYHFDPSKWIIWVSSKFGLTTQLRTINNTQVQKTLILKDKELLLFNLRTHQDKESEFLTAIENISTEFERYTSLLLSKLRKLKTLEQDTTTKYSKTKIRKEVKVLKNKLNNLWKDWIELTNKISLEYNIQEI